MTETPSAQNSSARRRTGSAAALYPLWVGLLATGGLLALFLSTGDPKPAGADSSGRGVAAPDKAADGGLPGATRDDEQEAPAPLTLTWSLLGAPAPRSGLLGACLLAAGHNRAQALGGIRDPLVVIHPTLGRPQRVTPRPDGALDVETPLERDRHRALILHVATVGCLAGPTTTVVDEALDRRYAATDRPRLSAGGGLPVGALIRIERVDVAGAPLSTTRGLARLGLPELGVPGGPEPRGDERALAQAAAALIAGGVPDDGRLALGAGAARLIRAADAERAGWWPQGQAVDRVLADPTAEPTAPFRAPPEPRIAPLAPVVTPAKRPRPVAPDNPRPPARRPEPKRPEPKRPEPKPPAFLPDYR